MLYEDSVYSVETELGGKKLILETGKYARQANGAVMATYGETMVLVTAVCAKEPKEDIDFFPLTVEYREKPSAAGKIPGGFLKREGKPSDKEILSARLIDRPIRPLFPDNFRNETQIVATVFSYDNEVDPDVIGAVAASAALHISNIPFLEPIGEVRVGKINGQLVINPTQKQIEECDLELVVAGTESSIMMVEGEANEVSEAELLEALKFAHEEIKRLVQLQKELREKCGKTKLQVPEAVINEELMNDVINFAKLKMAEIVATVMGKEERNLANSNLVKETVEYFQEKYPESEKLIKYILHDLEKDLMRKRILETGLRLDGRKTTEIRPIKIELGVLHRAHGSALFTRGETQSLTTLTLGSTRDVQIIDGLDEEYQKTFILHYNFPPFSVGEVGRMTGVGRREIGHGNLAERSLKRMVPSIEQFPYVVRLTSDILESNGSSSMATVCAGSLALMEGGVPVKDAVAGIAMGLITEDNKYSILSDILGNEDHLGDMDFKVAGTAKGITGFQMDIKIQGISFEILEKALEQAKQGRLHILNIMKQAISEPRKQLSKYAPAIKVIQVPVEAIGAIIGPGGKNIQNIQRMYKTEISIDEVGNCYIMGQDHELLDKCTKHLNLIVNGPTVGDIYEGKITKIIDSGAFVELLPGIEGYLHISQIAHKKVNKVADELKEGEIVKVRIEKYENGKINLSRKALIEKK